MFVINGTDRLVTFYGFHFVPGSCMFFRQYSKIGGRADLVKRFSGGDLTAFDSRHDALRYLTFINKLKSLRGPANIIKAAQALSGLRSFSYDKVIKAAQSTDSVMTIGSIKWIAAIMLGCDTKFVNISDADYVKAAKLVHMIKLEKLEGVNTDELPDAVAPAAKKEEEEPVEEAQVEEAPAEEEPVEEEPVEEAPAEEEPVEEAPAEEEPVEEEPVEEAPAEEEPVEEAPAEEEPVEEAPAEEEPVEEAPAEEEPVEEAPAEEEPVEEAPAEEEPVEEAPVVEPVAVVDEDPAGLTDEDTEETVSEPEAADDEIGEPEPEEVSDEDSNNEDPIDFPAFLEGMQKKEIAEYAESNYPDFHIVKKWTKEVLIENFIKHVSEAGK